MKNVNTIADSKIEIYVNGSWAGSGKFIDGQIVDCAAVLGGSDARSEEIYGAIEESIHSDRESLNIDAKSDMPLRVTWILKEIEKTVCGKQIQHDASGVGHAWKNIDRDDLTTDIAEEIAGEINDGGHETITDFVGSDGQHYRW